MTISGSNSPESLDIFYYAHNHAEFVERAIASILAQSLDQSFSVRLLCIDDGSTDETYENICSALKDYEDSVIGINRNFSVEVRKRSNGPALGQTLTFLEGLNWSRSDYFATLEGDDCWFSDEHVSSLIGELKKYNFTPAAFASWLSVSEHGIFMGAREPVSAAISHRLVDTRRLLQDNPPGTLSACLYRRAAIDYVKTEVVGVTNFADWGMNLFVSQLGPLCWSSKVTLLYRHVESSLWRRNSRNTQIQLMISLLKEYESMVCPRTAALLAERRMELHREIRLSRKVVFGIRHPIFAFKWFLNRANKVIRNWQSTATD